MAYLHDPYADEEEEGTMDVLSPAPMEQQPQQTAQQEAAAQSGGAIQASQPQGQAKAPAKQASGVHTNIQKYIGANKGEGQRLGEKAAQSQETEASKIRQAVESKKQQFQQDIGKAQQEVQGGSDFATQMIGQAGTSPFEQTDVDKFRSLMTEGATYQAPPTLSLSPEATRMQALQNITGRAGTESGRRGALESAFGKDDYTAGEKSLDELLLGSDTGAAQQFEESVADVGKGLGRELTQARTTAQQEKEQLLSQGQGLKQDIRTQLFGEGGYPVTDPETGELQVQGAFGETLDPLQQRVGAEREEAGKQYEAIRNMLERGYNVTPELLADIGVTDPGLQQEFSSLYERGQGRTLGGAIEQGGMDLDELRAVAEKTGSNYEDMKRLYTGQPMSIEEYAASINRNVNDAGMASNYATYSNALTEQSAAYRQQMDDFVGSELSDLRVKGPEMDFSRFLDSATGGISASNVATTEEYQRMLDLERLAGMQVGPLRQEQLGQAGTSGDLPYGALDIGTALSAARARYAQPVASPDFSGLDALPEQPLLGEVLQGGVESLTGQASDQLAGIDPLQGQIAQSAVLDPAATFVDETAKGLTEPLIDVEQGLGRVAEGDVLGGGVQSTLGAATSGGIQAGAAPLSATEKALLGGDTVSGVATDYTEALRGLSAGDFDGSAQAVGSTLQMPEQLTRDAAAKVDKVYQETEKAVSNAVSSAIRAASRVFSGGGSFFCTEMTKREVLSQEKLVRLHKFMYRILPFRTKFFSWYIDSAPQIVDIANERGYDWDKALEIVNNVIEKNENGDLFGAATEYLILVKDLCGFTDQKFPTDLDDFKLSNLKYLPKVVTFYIRELFK